MTGSIELPADKEMVMPGDNVTITVKLIAPSPWKKACVSPSVKAAVPSAPAWFRPSSLNGMTAKGWLCRPRRRCPR